MFFPSSASKSHPRLLEEKLIWLLQSCKTQKQLDQVQSHMTTHGFHHHDYVTPKIVSSCASLKQMGYARKVFDQIPGPNVSDWNAMFRGYSQNDFHKDVIILFRKMKRLGVTPNCSTFPVVVKSCVKIGAFKEGEELHCCVVKSGFKLNSFVGTTLIEMYCGGGKIGAASMVFGDMVDKNVVAWTSMISGYISCRDIATARRLFDMAPERDVVLWSIMVSGYAKVGNMVGAQELFNKMPNKDIMAWNTLMNGYANNGDIEACERFFEKIPKRNIFSWNGLIGGYARNSHYSKVLISFKRMLVDGGAVVPNDVTLVNVLPACARLGALDMGKWVHTYADNNGYTGDIRVRNALMDMYAKCGVIENAVEVFKRMENKDLVSWNTIIGGLAVHGRGSDALRLFSEMKNAGEKPDRITFIGVLCACSHLGLVEDGFSYFQTMTDDYSIVPQIEHYGCMIDMLARAGLLARAIDFATKTTIEPDAIIWATLLGACRVHKNIEIAELAFQKLVEFEPNNPGNYVMLSNIYGDLGRWKNVAQLKVAARDIGYRKSPGCSLIEVNNTVVEFYSLDERHPESDKIYEVLRVLARFSKSSQDVLKLMELDRGGS